MNLQHFLFQIAIKSKIYLLALMLFSVAGCQFFGSPHVQFDAEMRETFESQFKSGMTRVEVEKVLENVNGEVLILSETMIENGDILIKYQINTRSVGEPYYFFRFTQDEYLIVVFPPNA